MKLDSRFLTHVTKGEHYMISSADTDFKGIVKNNETAAFIIECLKTDTNEIDIVDKILNEYKGADRKTIEQDVTDVINTLRTLGAIEE